jgi:quercetin 2,3-dioxygenase
VEQVPHSSENGVDISLYSGKLAGLSSPIENYTAMILADIKVQPGVTTVFKLPSNFNTFLYVLSGSVMVGEEERFLDEDQVGWLDIFNSEALSEVKLKAGSQGVRFILYAGKPTGDNIVSHGPFIAGSNEDILRLYSEYRQGKMKHILSVGRGESCKWVL